MHAYVESRVPSASGRRRPLAVVLCLALLLTFLSAVATTTTASAAGSPCGSTINPIACENSQTSGVTPQSQWDIQGSGDDTIQGFATDISVNAGNTVQFKIDTDAKAYTIDIYRLGYYGGNGARKVASVIPSAALPQVQPSCATDPSVTLIDCGTWGVSASWAVPSTAVSGVYIAKLTRTDTGGASHISFIVRNDTSSSDIVYQTSDETWQAYNRYGGANFYTGSLSNLWDSPSRARKLSYNRPFATRDDGSGRDFLFSNEYPTIRFLEKNGYDVSYLSGVDVDRYGANLLSHHKVFLSVGHDEYWSQAQLTNVTNARDAGVNLMFLSGNEAYWHTRFEPSIDGSNTSYRTLVCYKETWDNAATDPTGEATATYRDPRFGAAPGGSLPENSLTGTIYKANSDDLAVAVTKAQGKTRLWRGTSLSSMTTSSTALAAHTVGYESDEDLDNGFRPAGLVDLSTTVGSTPQYLTDFGNTVVSGTTTHHLTLYRAASGALVFGAGTIQWGWGLDATHDGDTSGGADSRMQQATVNMLADMHAQPSTLASGLVAATASTDTQAPTSTITAPTAGQAIANGSKITVTGTATDTGGQVAGVEVSIDGGSTWHPASGTTAWTYTGILHGASTVKILSRATDDSANTETPAAGVGVSVGCPCTLFGSTTPGTVDSGDGSAVELGVRFSSSQDGYVTGVRFYKSSKNTGTHTGTLWSAAGAQLAAGTFTAESASGWQTLQFASPVAIIAGTTYVVSYYAPVGHYSQDSLFFYYRDYAASPLTAQSNSPTDSSKRNGVFNGGHGFPSSTYNGTNYYVDPIFSPSANIPPSVVAQTPTPGATSVATSAAPSATFSKAVSSASIVFTLKDSANTAVAGTVSYSSSTLTATFTPTSALSQGTTYTASVTASDTNGNAMTSPVTWTFQTVMPAGTPGTCPCTIFPDSWTPSTVTASDPNSVELGVKFTTNTDGVVTGIRFYKGPQNTGTHTGSLWSSSGALLATTTFTAESSSGWQTASFAQPVAVTAGATYIASYHAPVGGYSYTSGAFASSGVDNFPLHVPLGGAVYTYASGAPTSSSTANYGVDAVFTVPASVVPSVTSTAPVAAATGVATSTTVQASFSTSVLSGSPTMTLSASGGSSVAGSASLSADHKMLTFTPSAALSAGATYTASVSGARSLVGTAQTAAYTWSFTTAAASGGTTSTCPCSLFASTYTPAVVDSGDPNSVSLGVKVVPSVSGAITGVRFYKSSTNTGTHTVSVWSSSGTRLANLTVTGETASGWQSATFASPVAVTAGTTYVVSYYAPSGHYSYTAHQFDTTYTNGPLSAPSGTNGVYAYGADSFPTGSYNSSSYAVDVVFTDTAVADTTPPTVTATSPAGGATGVATSVAPTATFSEAISTSSLSFTVQSGTGGAVTGAVTYDSASRMATFTPGAALQAGTSYTAQVSAADLSGNVMTSPSSWTFTTAAASSSGCPCTLFGATATPTKVDSNDGSAVNLGVKFTSASAGYITGVRFYKAVANTGTHTGTLWSSAGQQLATGTFTNETASGWQTLQFATPVAITANTTYVAAYYAPVGHYSVDNNFFTATYSAAPLSAPAGSNGVYAYGASAFPTSSYNSSNYWVDPVFVTTVP